MICKMLWYKKKGPKSVLVLVSALLCSDVIGTLWSAVDIAIWSFFSIQLIWALVSTPLILEWTSLSINVEVGALVCICIFIRTMARMRALTSRSHESLEDTLCCIQMRGRTHLSYTFGATVIRILELYS